MKNNCQLIVILPKNRILVNLAAVHKGEQIKDPSNFHCGLKKEGYRLFVIDYYTRQRDTVYMIPTGDVDNPYREASSYLKEWKEVALILDKHWSDQNYLINNR